MFLTARACSLVAAWTHLLLAPAFDGMDPARTNPRPAPPMFQDDAELRWCLDYKTAVRAARDQGRMLFLWFADSEHNEFEDLSLTHPAVVEDLSRFVLAKLSVNAAVTVDGSPERLLDHPAFEPMRGRQGIAIIDFKHAQADYYGDVVSAFPFPVGTYYSVEEIDVMLGLPPGTLTQRTLIYAVRTHPEAPASADGLMSPFLAEQAEQHSLYQASIQLQGHHNWTRRFYEINEHLTGRLAAQEVCAESWPGQPLLEAAIECVHSWRRSPGHWAAVQSPHSLYGYDMKRGSDGVWYATGLFAD